MITNLLCGVLLYKDSLGLPPSSLKGIIGGVIAMIIVFWLAFTSDKGEG